VEHEGEPLGRRECLEDDEQREADGVGEHDLVFGVGSPGRRRGGLAWLAWPAAERFLSP